MPLTRLAKEAFLGELGALPETGVECTRLASISVTDTAPPVRAYLKIFASTYGSGLATRGLVNEVAGYFCAEAGGLSVAQQAGLITLEPSMISNPPSWLASTSPLVAWWSQDMAHPSIRASLNIQALPNGSAAQQDAFKQALDMLLKFAGTPAVIALDDLVANIDRNLGNALYSPAGISLIDHGHCLTGPAWVAGDLDSGKSYDNKVRSFLGASGETLSYKSSIMAAYTQIAKDVAPKLPQLKHLAEQLVSASDAAALNTFLERRSVLSSIPHRVGVVV